MIVKIYLKMVSMEQTKYLAPRFTDSLKELANYFGCFKSRDQKDKY